MADWLRWSTYRTAGLSCGKEAMSRLTELCTDHYLPIYDANYQKYRHDPGSIYKVNRMPSA